MSDYKNYYYNLEFNNVNLKNSVKNQSLEKLCYSLLPRLYPDEFEFGVVDVSFSPFRI